MAVSALGAYADTEENATRAAELLIEADNRTTYQAITDARRAFEQESDQLPIVVSESALND